MSGINNPMFGKKHTNETKVKISRANIGKNYGHAGKNHCWFGKNHSKESKLKMRNSNLGPNNRLYGSDPWENPKTINSNTSKNWYHLDIIYDIWEINNTLGYVNFYNLVLSIYPNLTKSKTSFKNIRLWFIKNGNPRTHERWKHWKNNNIEEINNV